MAFANFTDLKATIASWLHRADLTTLIPDLITLGEAHLNRELVTGMQNYSDTLTLSVGTSSTADAASFGPLRSVRRADGIELINALPDEITTLLRVHGTTRAAPNAYCYAAGRTEFDYIADVTYTLYSRRDNRLTIATDATNWLLTNHPDAYLYASLSAAAPYLRDDPRVGLWISQRDAAIRGVNKYYRRYGNVSLRTDDLTSITGGSAYDIRAG